VVVPVCNRLNSTLTGDKIDTHAAPRFRTFDPYEPLVAKTREEEHKVYDLVERSSFRLNPGSTHDARSSTRKELR